MLDIQNKLINGFIYINTMPPRTRDEKKIVVMLSGIILEIKYQRPEYLYNISELI